jgi:hypothetical protein
MRAMKSLEEAVLSNGGVFLPDADLLTMYETRFGWWSFNAAAYNVSNSPVELFPYRVSTYLPITSGRPSYFVAGNRIERAFSRFFSNFERRGFSGLSLGSAGSLIYSDHRRGNPHSREEVKSLIVQNLEKVSAAGLSLAVTCGNAYTLPYVSHVLEAPLYDSGFLVSHTSVPFYHLVLHGLINITEPAHNGAADSRTQFLRQLEAGALPLFTFTWEPSNLMADTSHEYLLNTEFSRQKDRAVELYLEFKEVYEGLNDVLIDDHRIVGDVRVTVFESGVSVYVNFGSYEAVVDGVSIAPMSYGVTGREAVR